MAMSFLAIKYYTKMTRRRFVLAIYSYQVCIQKELFLIGRHAKRTPLLSCWAERRASSFKTLLRNPLPCPAPLPSIRALEKREFLVMLLLSLLLCLKLMNTKLKPIVLLG